jgi:hypothetical protein
LTSKKPGCLLTVTDKAVERLTVFVEPRLFESFGLPEVYEG